MINTSSESSGTKITIYLHDNLAGGWRDASIDQWSGKAICFPLERMSKVMDHEKSARLSCVYFLIGAEPEGAKVKRKIYVGQTDNFQQRMINHRSKKDWIENIVIIRSLQELSVNALKYLEHKLFILIDKVNYDASRNKQEPQMPNFALEDKAGYEIILKNIQILIPMFGYDILRSMDVVEDSESETSVERNILKYKGATGYALPDGKFRVTKGSTVSSGIAEHFINHTFNDLRNSLLEERIIENLTFTESYDFKSKSAAACVIAGSSVNGKAMWKGNDNV